MKLAWHKVCIYTGNFLGEAVGKRASSRCWFMWIDGCHGEPWRATWKYLSKHASIGTSVASLQLTDIFVDTGDDLCVGWFAVALITYIVNNLDAQREAVKVKSGLLLSEAARKKNKESFCAWTWGDHRVLKARNGTVYVTPCRLPNAGSQICLCVMGKFWTDA